MFNQSLKNFKSRLWGNHGQTDLENSRICLVNASTVG